MAIRFEVRLCDDLLFARVSGRDESLEEVQEYGETIIRLARAHGCTRVLTDERAPECELDTVDTYELAEHYSGVAPRLMKTGVVCDPRQVNDAKFWETVTTNRGLLFRVFTTLDEAAARVGTPDLDPRGGLLLGSWDTSEGG